MVRQDANVATTEVVAEQPTHPTYKPNTRNYNMRTSPFCFNPIISVGWARPAHPTRVEENFVQGGKVVVDTRVGRPPSAENAACPTCARRARAHVRNIVRAETARARNEARGKDP